MWLDMRDCVVHANEQMIKVVFARNKQRRVSIFSTVQDIFKTTSVTPITVKPFRPHTSYRSTAALFNSHSVVLIDMLYLRAYNDYKGNGHEPDNRWRFCCAVWLNPVSSNSFWRSEAELFFKKWSVLYFVTNLKVVHKPQFRFNIQQSQIQFSLETSRPKLLGNDLCMILKMV